MKTFQITAQYMVMIGIGYFLKKSKLLSAHDANPIGKIVLCITLPATIVSSFSGSVYDHWMLISILLGFAYAFATLMLMLRLTKNTEQKARALYLLNSSGLNLGNIAIPYLIMANPATIIYAGMYSTGDSIIALGGTYAAAGMVLSHKEGNHFKAIIKGFSSPPLVAFVVMAIVVITGIHIPEFIVEFCDTLSGANTPLCMFLIGLSLNFSKGAVNTKIVFHVICYRFICSCILAAITVFCFKTAPVLMRQAIAICVFSAIPNIAVVYSKNLDLDTASAGLLNTITALFAIPMLALMNLLVANLK